MDLNQLTLPSKDVAKSVAFYKKLGLNLIVDFYSETMPGPNVRMVNRRFHYTTVLSSAPIVGFGFIFELNKLDSTVNSLIEQGVVFDELPNDKEWGWRESRLKDPDGHQLILYHAGEYRKNPPWRVEMET